MKRTPFEQRWYWRLSSVQRKQIHFQRSPKNAMAKNPRPGDGPTVLISYATVTVHNLVSREVLMGSESCLGAQSLESYVLSLTVKNLA